MRVHYVCDGCGAWRAKLQCSQCRTSFYCDTKCQKSDWPTHQSRCRQLAGWRMWKKEMKRVARVLMDADGAPHVTAGPPGIYAIDMVTHLADTLTSTTTEITFINNVALTEGGERFGLMQATVEGLGDLGPDCVVLGLCPVKDSEFMTFVKCFSRDAKRAVVKQ